MNTNHTPGPWTYNDPEPGKWDVLHEPRGEGRGWRVVAYEAATEADAALIAAAPDMLEALYALLNVEGAAIHGARVEAEADPTRVALDVPYHFEKARAAIAKAEGRTDR